MRSGLSGECITCSNVTVHTAWDAVELTLEVGFIYPFVVIDPPGSGATMVVAPGQMLDDFQPIPDAGSLPLYLWYGNRLLMEPITVLHQFRDLKYVA